MVNCAFTSIEQRQKIPITRFFIGLIFALNTEFGELRFGLWMKKPWMKNPLTGETICDLVSNCVALKGLESFRGKFQRWSFVQTFLGEIVK